MATRLVGLIGTFDPTTSKWSSYSARLHEYLVANGIKGRKKVAVLLSVVGGKAYDLRDLFAPDMLNTKTYDELVKKLGDHLEPQPTVIAERYKLYQWQQKPEETVAEYMAALRRFASTCNFEQFFEQALRDQFVCGLANEKIKMELLQLKTPR